MPRPTSMPTSPIPFLAVAFLAATLVAMPLAAADSKSLAAERARLSLVEAPQQAIQVLDVQKRLLAEKRHTGRVPGLHDVVIVGQIGGLLNVWPDTHPNYPWYPGQASFFMVDSNVAARFARHIKRHGGGRDCAFCRQLAAKNVKRPVSSFRFRSAAIKSSFTFPNAS